MELKATEGWHGESSRHTRGTGNAAPPGCSHALARGCCSPGTPATALGPLLQPWAMGSEGVQGSASCWWDAGSPRAGALEELQGCTGPTCVAPSAGKPTERLVTAQGLGPDPHPRLPGRSRGGRQTPVLQGTAGTGAPGDTGAGWLRGAPCQARWCGGATAPPLGLGAADVQEAEAALRRAPGRISPSR